LTLTVERESVVFARNGMLEHMDRLAGILRKQAIGSGGIKPSRVTEFAPADVMRSDSALEKSQPTLPS